MERRLRTDIIKSIKYPRRAGVELYGIILNQVFNGNGGIDVMAEDWDNLIILDACRYDLFEEVNDIHGELRSKKSRGSHTDEFTRKNFNDREFSDSVYVNASPNVARSNAKFAAVSNIWVDKWDEEFHTVLPEEVTNEALRCQEEYPNKRLIAHYMQPHYPWIGENGRDFHRDHGYKFLHQDDNVWIRLREKSVDKERLWRVYKENLEVTLPHVSDLINELPGRTVVTSDHGNGFGEMGVYGHPPRAYIEPLVKVPWLIIDQGERKRIVPSESMEAITMDDEDLVKDRLENLGYL